MKKFWLLLIITLLPSSTWALSAQAYVVMDQKNNRVLEGSNYHQEHLIASITKIMTAYTVLNSRVKLNEKVMVSDEILAAYGSSIYLTQEEVLTIKDLLYGLMLRSGNDAALVLAKNTYQNNFIKQMNKHAKDLKMYHTTFYNPHGLETADGENKSSAYDMALLTNKVMYNKTYRQIVSSKHYQTTSSLKSYVWKNKNKLLFNYEYTTGGKTGFTKKAGRTLVTTGKKDHKKITIVTLNDPQDFSNHKKLYEKVFNNYQNYLLLKKKIKLPNNQKAFIKKDYYLLLKENEIKHLMINYQLKKKPQKTIGKAQIMLNNQIIDTLTLYAKKVKND